MLQIKPQNIIPITVTRFNLQKKLDQSEMEKLHRKLQQSFVKNLGKKGLNPDTITDQEAEKILNDLSA